MTVNENGYINKSNVATKKNNNYKVTINFNISNPLEKDSNDSSDNKGYYIEVLDANENKVNVDKTGGSTISDKKADVVLHKNLVKDSVDIYLKSDAEEGLYTIVLKDKNNNVVSKVKTELNTKTPKAVVVSTERLSSAKATLSLTAVNSGATKVYYIVLPTADANGNNYKNTSVNDVVQFVNGTKSDSKGKIVSKGTATLTDNKLDACLVATELSSNSSYKIFYVLESKEGNVSGAVEKTDILVDNELNSEPKVNVTTIVEPDLKNVAATSSKTFTWTAPTGMTSSKYMVVIYKDDEIIDEVECASASFDTNTNQSLLDLSKPGTYKISVRVKGNGTTTKDSEPVESDEVVVTALSPVEIIKLESATKLTWNDTKNGTNANNYDVSIKQLTGTISAVTTPTVDVAKKEATIAAKQIKDNEIYEITITAKAAATQSAIVDSEETVKKCFVIGVTGFAVDTTKTTDTAITLNASKIVIDGKEASYDVKVYKVNHDNVPEKGQYHEITSGDVKTTMERDDNGNLVILVNGLAPETEYAFRLIATVGDSEGTSIYEEEKTCIQAPSVNGKQVVKSKDLAKAEKVYAYTNNTKKIIVVDGIEYNISDNEYPAEFESLYELIVALNSNDTIVKAEGDSLQLKLGNTARVNLVLGKTVKGKKVEIEGAAFETNITVSSGYETTEMILKGEGAQFNVAGLNADTIKLADDVTIFSDTTARKFEIAKVATINGVQITTETALKATVTGKTVDIHVNSGTMNNNLTIENSYPENIASTLKTQEAVIRFVGETDNSSVYIGTVTISSTDGGIKVSQERVNVTGISLDIDVTDANVELKDVAFTGNRNVNVTLTADATKTVTVLAKDKAPVTLESDDNFELKTYKDAEGNESLEALRGALKATTTHASDADSMTEAELTRIQAFLNSFGINDIGAKIVTTKDNNEITITFTKKAESVQIQGIN